MAAQKIITRDFILCFLAQFTFTSAYHILIPTLPIYLSRSGSTEAEIGVLIGVLGVSSLVLRPFVGRALLRIPEKKFMTAGALVFLLTSIAYLLAPPFWPFFMVRVLQGTALALFYTASVILVCNISPETHRGQCLSYYYLAFNISFALAPSLGMFLISRYDFTLLFFICTGLSLCSLFITNKLGKTKVDPADNSCVEENPFFNRKIVRPATMVFFVHVIWGSLTAFFPLYAIHEGVANSGLFFTAYAVVLILARGFGGKILDLYSREKVILPCLTTYIISMTILAYSKSLPMFILVAVIWGIGNAFLIPSLVTYALELAPTSRGPAMGTFTAISDLGVGLGPVIMGLVLRSTSYPVMFLCLALTGAINLNYFYFFVRRRG